MNIHVKSNDPRKPAIVAALKAKSGATKVTMVRQVGPTTFTGDCMKPLSKHSKQYMKLGSRTVDVPFLNVTPLDATALKRLGAKTIGSCPLGRVVLVPEKKTAHDRNQNVAKYENAVDWIAHNDAAGDDLSVVDLKGMLTVVLTADIFGLDEQIVAQDVFARRKEIGL